MSPRQPGGEKKRPKRKENMMVRLEKLKANVKLLNSYT